ncbi:PTS galactitol transporter subunit IIA [Rouxiella sp. S1S-2]|uniref:PTS galactitol transporter subunit IIA n=1 Tax=Rouxiella sp. S1S-2 TaxID=2653856 RepID=UPI0012647AD8|nr:PTS galactitol transporter subunit IIA [Rouxiella sp. S1S-2]KAB7896334.1 PTS galactitol transporter subunit IIA [Rouxiella sp. S1S-2]
MKAFELNVADGIPFKSYENVFKYLHEKLTMAGIVKESYLEALIAREREYPTGIELDGYAVAIPHCDTEHALKPSIYILRTPQPILVNQADGDNQLETQLIINLVVTNPLDQLQLLKSLFSNLQDKDFYKKLLELPAEEAKSLFNSKVVA